MPAADAQFGGGRKKLVVGQIRPVVKDGDEKIQLLRQRHHGLRHVARTRNPQFHGRRHRFLIKPVSRRDGTVRRVPGAPSFVCGTAAGRRLPALPASQTMEKSSLTPQPMGSDGAASLRQSSAAFAACGRMTPVTLPPQMSPSSQPKSWSRTRLNSAGWPVFTALSARAWTSALQAATSERANDFPIRKKYRLWPRHVAGSTLSCRQSAPVRTDETAA